MPGSTGRKTPTEAASVPAVSPAPGDPSIGVSTILLITIGRIRRGVVIAQVQVDSGNMLFTKNSRITGSIDDSRKSVTGIPRYPIVACRVFTAGSPANAKHCVNPRHKIRVRDVLGDISRGMLPGNTSSRFVREAHKRVIASRTVPDTPFVNSGVFGNHPVFARRRSTGRAAIARNPGELYLFILGKTRIGAGGNGVTGNTPKDAIHVLVEIVSRSREHFVDCGLLEKRKEQNHTAWTLLGNTDRHNSTQGIVKIMDADADLFQLAGTLHTPCRFACRLDRREKKGDKNADNRNDYEQFNESERTAEIKVS